MKFKQYALATLIYVILLYVVPNIFSEQAYAPYPIIFIHGFRSYENESWTVAKNNLKIYFKDGSNYKYPDYSLDSQFFPSCNYGFAKSGAISKNGYIPYIATGVLAPSIDYAITHSFPAGYEGEKKVNIVAHSMGGLVTRSLLTQLSDYRSKINKVVFIGTPHRGSPYASALWMINNEANEKLPPLIDQYSTFYSRTAGTLKFLGPLASPPIYNHISWQLQEKLNRDKNVLWTVKQWPFEIDPDGYAIDQMRIPFHSEYRDTVSGWYGWQYKSVPIDIVYEPNETFLGQTNLFSPPDSVSIRGTNDSPLTYAILLGIDLLNFYREGIPFGFNFPSGYTINEAKSPGDGFVTQASQGAIGGVKDITASHLNETMNQEAFKIILQAIDDPPQVERIRVIARDTRENNLATPHYVIFKIKEYLLADVGVLSLKLDGTNIISGYKYGEDFQLTGPYKPYDDVAYPEKGFLKERDDPSATVTDINGTTTRLHLYPGEFYITVNLTYGKHEIKIKLKNAADKETDELTYYVSMPKIYNLYNTTTYYFVSGNGTRYPGEVNNGYINVPPFQPTEQPDDAWIDTKTKISFSIADELFNHFKVDVWIYDKYGHTLIRKLPIANPNVTLLGSEGNYYGNFQTFCAWDGKDDNGRDVPDQRYYQVKVIATPVDDSYVLPQLNDLKQCLIATSQDYPSQDLIYADPSFVQASREPQDSELVSENEKSFYEDKLYASARPNTIMDVTNLSNEELTCKIQVPFPNSLVRADVPVFGLAYGKDFKQYKLEYGEGLNPTAWKKILTSTKPNFDTRLIKEIASAGATIRGNLGTWDTGLTEYEHNNKKHQADLNGLYTLRLTVTDTHGNIKEDRVPVQVGRAVSFAFGGKAISPDGKAEVTIPEHSIKDSFEVMGISEVNNAAIKEKYSLKSKAYKIIPEEYFTEPAALKIKLDDDYKENLSDLKICAFDMAKGECFLLPTEADLKDNTIYANVTYLSSSYCYAAVEVKDEPALIYPEKKAQPDYAYALVEGPFDMRQQPIVTFGYKCDPDTKINLIAKVGKKYYDIQIKDDLKTYHKNNLKKAGKIDGFIADGKTHNIKIDLYAFLSRFTSTTTVEELILADLDASGYMDLHPGRSNLKESVSVENIRLEKRSGVNRLAARSKDPSWSIGIYDDDPTEFELENNSDKNYSIGAPFDKFNRAITPDVPVSNINFKLTRAQSKGNYILTLDAISTDTSKKGYVRFKVLLNGKPLETLQASHWAGELFQIPIRDGLKKGGNTLTLQWLDGGSWVTWDYVSFQQL